MESLPAGEERRHEAEVLRRFVREREFTRYSLENLGRKMGENACFLFFFSPDIIQNFVLYYNFIQIRGILFNMGQVQLE